MWQLLYRVIDPICDKLNHPEPLCRLVYWVMDQFEDATDVLS